MSDLISSLRDHGWVVAAEAADEIERLTAERDALRAQVQALQADAERLRVALRMVLMLRQLGGMLPGTHQIVQSIVDAARAALEGKP